MSASLTSSVSLRTEDGESLAVLQSVVSLATFPALHCTGGRGQGQGAADRMKYEEQGEQEQNKEVGCRSSAHLATGSSAPFLYQLTSVSSRAGDGLAPHWRERPSPATTWGPPVHLGATFLQVYSTPVHLGATFLQVYSTQEKHLGATFLHVYSTPVHLGATFFQVYSTPVHLGATCLQVYSTPVHLGGHLPPGVQHTCTPGGTYRLTSVVTPSTRAR